MRMELGLSQHQTIKQIQTLSPQMYMSMEILCLNSLDLEERIDAELEDNETLDLAEAGTRTEEGAEGSSPSDPTTEVASPETPSTEVPGEDSFEERFETWGEYAQDDSGDFGGARRSPSSYAGEKDEKLDALSNTEGRPMSLQEHLVQQVHLLDRDELMGLIRAAPVLNAADAGDSRSAEDATGSPQGPLMSVEEEAEIRSLCEDVIYNVDGRGYVMYSLEEIADALDPRPALETLEKALAVVQGLEPPGIGGRDLKECLILQLRRDRQQYPLEERIIEHHLADLGKNRLPKIAKAIGVTLDDVKVAVENIASLNPIPGKLYGGESQHFIKPDVIVEEVEEGRYEVRVESGYLPRLQISSQYRDLYRTSRANPELKKYLKKKLDGAEWLMAAIRQRQSTLLRIAEEVVEVQQGFFDHGVSHLKPLKMVEIAERVGVHVSTISRAISNKYMQTPRGIFAMKYFFTGGATRSDGSVESRSSVIQRIKDLVDSEDKENPLSDIDIVKRLAEQSIRISRRTVTKYREAENIASSRERRNY